MERKVAHINGGSGKVAYIDVGIVVAPTRNVNWEFKVTDIQFQEGSLFTDYDENIIEMNRLSTVNRESR